MAVGCHHGDVPTVNDIATIVTAIAAMIAAVAALFQIRPEWFGRFIAILRPHHRDITIAGGGAVVAWLLTFALGLAISSSSTHTRLESPLRLAIISAVVLTIFLGVRGVIIAMQQNQLARSLRAGTFLVAATGALIATFAMTA